MQNCSFLTLASFLPIILGLNDLKIRRFLQKKVCVKMETWINFFLKMKSSCNFDIMPQHRQTLSRMMVLFRHSGSTRTWCCLSRSGNLNARQVGGFVLHFHKGSVTWYERDGPWSGFIWVTLNQNGKTRDFRNLRLKRCMFYLDAWRQCCRSVTFWYGSGSADP